MVSFSFFLSFYPRCHSSSGQPGFRFPLPALPRYSYERKGPIYFALPNIFWPSVSEIPRAKIIFRLVSRRQLFPFSTRSMVRVEIPALRANSALLKKSFSRKFFRGLDWVLNFSAAPKIPFFPFGHEQKTTLQEQFHNQKYLSTFFLIYM
jgi:hypothetical protein